MDIEIHSAPAPSTEAAEKDQRLTRALFAAMNSLDEEWVQDAYGHDDFMEPVQVHVKRFARQRYTRKHLWVAYPAGADPLTAAPEDAVGYA